MGTLKEWVHNKIFRVYEGENTPERKKYQKYKIYLKGRFFPIKFKGEYLRALEATNWHYYQDHKGLIWHFRKEDIQGVHGDNIKSVMDNRPAGKG